MPSPPRAAMMTRCPSHSSSPLLGLLAVVVALVVCLSGASALELGLPSQHSRLYVGHCLTADAGRAP